MLRQIVSECRKATAEALASELESMDADPQEWVEELDWWHDQYRHLAEQAAV